MISSRDFNGSSRSAAVCRNRSVDPGGAPTRWTPGRRGHQRGQISWPPPGRFAGHQRADTWPPTGRIPWPPSSFQSTESGSSSFSSLRNLLLAGCNGDNKKSELEKVYGPLRDEINAALSENLKKKGE